MFGMPAPQNINFLPFLRYASRAKEVTNAAQRNADNKEIARLKAVSSTVLRIFVHL